MDRENRIDILAVCREKDQVCSPDAYNGWYIQCISSWVKKEKMTSAALRKSCIWPDSFAAYEQFVAWLLHPEESVDIFSGGTMETLSSVQWYSRTRLNMCFHGWSTGVCQVAPLSILPNEQNGHYKGAGLCKYDIKGWPHGNRTSHSSCKTNT